MPDSGMRRDFLPLIHHCPHPSSGLVNEIWGPPYREASGQPELGTSAEFRESSWSWGCVVLSLVPRSLQGLPVLPLSPSCAWLSGGELELSALTTHLFFFRWGS